MNKHRCVDQRQGNRNLRVRYALVQTQQNWPKDAKGTHGAGSWIGWSCGCHRRAGDTRSARRQSSNWTWRDMSIMRNVQGRRLQPLSKCKVVSYRSKCTDNDGTDTWPSAYTSCASPPNDGTLCHYYKHRQDCCFKLPDSVSLEEGALVEPLSVGIYSVERGNVKPGDRVFVFGAGPVGLLCAAAAKAAGACHIAVADISQSRLDFAKSYCTDSQILLERPKPGEPNIEYSRRTTEQILQQEGGIRPNCVFDCTGAETCVQMTVMVRKRRTCSGILLVMTLDIYHLLQNLAHQERGLSCTRRLGCRRSVSTCEWNSYATSWHQRHLPLL